MRKGIIIFLIIGVLLTLVFLSADKEIDHSKANLEIPATFVDMVIPEENKMTQEKVALGRLLFYDPILSRDSTVSCSSCHIQSLAFTDGQSFSLGVEGKIGKRSALSLVNVGYYYKGLFWDGRSSSLEEQALHPILDTLEMGNKWPYLISRLEKSPLYKAKFALAFPERNQQEITPKQIGEALAQFQRTIISADSKYDQVERGEATFSASEARGMDIFFDKSDTLPVAECGHCHLDPLFTNQDFENNGIDIWDTIQVDLGRKAISGLKYDLGKFRTPTLRNIALTAPYMHDGRFETLEEVIDHYNKGGHPGLNVSPNVMPLHLSERDKNDLISFLNTLTDYTLLSNKQLSDPFLQNK